MTSEQTTLGAVASERLTHSGPAKASGVWQELFPQNPALRHPSLLA